MTRKSQAIMGHCISVRKPQHFQAPEIMGLIHPETSEYTNAVDMGSLGGVTYELLTQKVPFTQPKEISLFCKGGIRFPDEALIARRVSSEGMKFIESLMEPEPSKRLTTDAASRAPWVGMGADIKVIYPQGGTALHQAAYNGQEAAIRLLLEKGADITAADPQERTALHRAKYKGHKAAIRLLQSHDGLSL